MGNVAKSKIKVKKHNQLTTKKIAYDICVSGIFQLLHFSYILDGIQAYLWHIFPRLPTPFAHSDGVIIRTNGGTLTINGYIDQSDSTKGDVIYHYGDATKVDVQAVANASYHENGDVDLIKVKKGHIQLEAQAKVLGVYVYNNSTNAQKDTSFAEIKITVKAGAELPQLSRSAVVIADEGTKVCTVVTEEAKDIYLFQQGVFEQIKTVDEGKNVASDASAAWADDASKNNDKTQTAAQQLANELNASFEVNNVTYTVTVDTTSETRELVVTNTDTNETVTDTNIVKEAVDQSGSSETAAIADLPLRGDGLSWKTAFEIYDYATMQKINEFYDVGYRYFKVVIEKTNNGYIDCKNWIPVNLNGSIDGKGVKIINLDKSLFMDVDGESVAISNFDITANISVSGGVSAVVGDDCNSLNLVIDNVNVHGTIIGASWVVSYVTFGPGPSNAWNCTIKNSVSDATLVATSGAASGFVGHPYDDVSNGSVNGKSLITIIDSAYIGNMSATGSLTDTNFKYFTINGNDNRVKTSYSDTFIDRLGFNPEGALYAVPTNAANYPVVVNDDGSKTFFCGNYGKNVVDNYIKPYSKAQLNTTAKASLPANVGDVFTVTKVSGATKAVVSLLIAPNDSNNYGSYLGTYMTEEIDITAIEANSSFTSENVRYFTININSGVTSATGVSGDIFNVVNPYYGINAHNGATVQIVQFDTNGNVLNITSIKIATAHAAE